MLDDLVIVGIDPGTISAYAVLSLDGELIALGSRRNSSLGTLIQDVTRFGKVFTIGCDVTSSPNTVTKIATKIGARIITPHHNLTFEEKIHLVDAYLKEQDHFLKLKNKHEKDALACALYSLKRIRTLHKKIDDHLKQENKIFLTDPIRKKVLLENMPITKALRQF